MDAAEAPQDAQKHPLMSYREAHGLSQAELADTLSVSRMTVWRWEKGERQPDPDKLSDITAKTGIPARELRPDLAEKLGADQ